MTCTEEGKIRFAIQSLSRIMDSIKKQGGGLQGSGTTAAGIASVINFLQKALSD